MMNFLPFPTLFEGKDLIQIYLLSSSAFVIIALLFSIEKQIM